MDFLPWWFNEVAFEDKRDGVRSLDVFDFHAYPGGPSGTAAQNQALALRLPRDFWDPNYVSEDGSINQNWATQTQPLKTIAFRHSAAARAGEQRLCQAFTRFRRSFP